MLDGGFKYVLFSSLFGEDEPILTNFCLKMGWFNHQQTCMSFIRLSSSSSNVAYQNPLGPGGWNLKAMPLEPKWASQMDQAWKSSSASNGLRLVRPCGGPNKLGRFGPFLVGFLKGLVRNGATFFDTIFWRNFGWNFICLFFFPWVSNQPSSTIVSINFSWFESLKFPVMFVAMLIPHF